MIEIVAALIYMLKVFDVEAALVAALTVKLNVPDAVGVPEILPEVLSVSPVGKFPDVIVHEALLTDAASCAL